MPDRRQIHHLSGIGSHSQLGYRLRRSDPRAHLRGIRRASPPVIGEGMARHESRVKRARHSELPVVDHAGQRTALTDVGPVVLSVANCQWCRKDA
jgi:hypothetical protein